MERGGCLEVWLRRSGKLRIVFGRRLMDGSRQWSARRGSIEERRGFGRVLGCRKAGLKTSGGAEGLRAAT